MTSWNTISFSIRTLLQGFWRAENVKSNVHKQSLPHRFSRLLLSKHHGPNPPCVAEYCLFDSNDKNVWSSHYAICFLVLDFIFPKENIISFPFKFCGVLYCNSVFVQFSLLSLFVRKGRSVLLLCSCAGPFLVTFTETGFHET